MARVTIVIEDVSGPELIDIKVDPPDLLQPTAPSTAAIQVGRTVLGLAVGAKLLLATGVNIGLDAAEASRLNLGGK
jgi:hypothetical protein